MSCYNIEFGKFIKSFIPVAIREGNLFDLIQVMCSPLVSLYVRFMQYRAERLYFMQYTSQVCLLEKLLNDYLQVRLLNAGASKRIILTDENSVEKCLVYPVLELKPVLIGCIGITKHTTWQISPLTVLIPSEMIGDNVCYDIVEKLVNRYKLLGIKHTINYY